METKEIIDVPTSTLENNKLIAEFMGISTEENGMQYILVGDDEFYIDLTDEDSLKFNTSWDWLMLVVEKIENLEYINREGRFSINSINFEENYTAYVIDGEKGIIQVEGETKIQATYKAVIEFIKWYNLNK